MLQRALLARPDASALLDMIRCPALVLCGNEDAWAPADRHRAMAERIPGATLALVPDCGHMSTMERPEAVTAAMKKWFAAVIAAEARHGQNDSSFAPPTTRSRASK